ncbi:MAG: diacylglycerol kinase family protein [bacterium]
MNSVQRFFKSVMYACKGIVHVFSNEQNFRLQSFIAILVIIGIFWLRPSLTEIAILVLTIVIVFVVEFTNTVFERVADVLKPRLHPYAKTIKDVMAGSVLFSVLGSIAVGLIIFLPIVIEKYF